MKYAFKCHRDPTLVNEILKRKEDDLPRRLSRQEKGFAHMEHKNTNVEDIQSRHSRESQDVRGPQAEPMFSTGQSVLHWWSSWFRTATAPLMQISKKSRLAWFDATIIASLGQREVQYAGYTWTSYAYQVH